MDALVKDRWSNDHAADCFRPVICGVRVDMAVLMVSDVC